MKTYIVIVEIQLSEMMYIISREFKAEIEAAKGEEFENWPNEVFLFACFENGSERVRFKSKEYFEKLFRNKMIFNDYINGVDLNVIASKNNLSARRIQQIIKSFKK